MTVDTPITGWISSEVARRVRALHGVFHWTEWRDCCRALDVRVFRRPLPEWSAGMRADRTIFVPRDLSVRESALTVWHELGHILMHDGGWEFWDQLPWGYLVLGKQERQADELALLLPDWSGF